MIYQPHGLGTKIRAFLNRLTSGKITQLGTNYVTSQFKKVPKRSRKKLLIVLTYASSFVMATTVIVFFGVIFVFAYFSRQLPSPNTLLERSDELSTRYYDRKGTLIFEQFGEKNRTLVKYEDIPQSVIDATLATEDAEFYTHQGFSPRGMLRAIRNMITGEGGIQSGSTLTQQAIKNTLLTSEQTVVRKIKELILSLQLENRYSKEEIIQMYLNETPYGGQNYGIYSAAKAYFNKEPKELTTAESAYIAGLPQSPSRYSQFGITPELGIERKNYVLYLMNSRGWVGDDGKRHFLNNEEYEKVKAETLTFETAKIPLAAPHFVFYTKQYLSDILGEQLVENGGLRIMTTLDLDTHSMAQKIVEEEVDKAKDANLNLYNGSMVVLDPKTGQILSMVGSRGYNLDPEPLGCTPGGSGTAGCKFDPYVNVATSRRQPGSSIKPITYATLLSKGYTAATPLIDVRTKFKGSAPDKPYSPVNYDGQYRGVMPVRKSLANSLNVAAVKALDLVGISSMVDQAEKMGITTFDDKQNYGLAITLGGVEARLLDLTASYTVFANKGTYNKPTPILEVQNSKGEVIYRPTTPPKKVLDEGVAFIISDILSDDGARSEAFGTHSLLYIPGYQVAVKTGTTDEKKDNYAVGYTPYIAAGVWVGNNNNEPMNQYIASGISGASPIWNRFMKEYLATLDEKAKTPEKFDPPANVSKITVDSLSGMLPYEDQPTRGEWFVKGTEPTTRSAWYERLEICEVDGRIANDSCRNADKTEEKNYIDIREHKPEWQAYVDEWVKKEKGGDSKYYPPTMVSALEFEGDEVKNKDNVSVKAYVTGFEEGKSVPLDFRIKVETSTYEDIEVIRFYKDGEKVGEDSNEPFGYTFSLGASDIGKHEFKVSATDEKGNKGETKFILDVTGYARE
ncbi:hypothetical protein A3K34_01385 [candidate division WWE3 bacterium RIFOXYC1_FULL_40_10]|nr:MAG: hypothetical protein A3K58_01385 [candidate division WWE3 bacterium RIFOXYB1_FULL_40_22]OGC61523.1 MAG: hypothetical protein A3K37_01385 [candidate division WWE3 bacterium RIFOXYA1_FULL_40_11]OGC64797.1 MAG: hypothetical protein A2326_02070 [candidate division WWE3 bacterium RIFOXYB2_FULL_41_6]OGC65906.1 MAG: hypothetical protein A3K34_01385 [candidate division WWE3 bacterium RIFOXYC1_FULL_40_10]OGC71138.1 MAG: hypothetical protein A2602_01470 [candidate division WWE3 bacterium RIFOXYD1